MTTTPDLPQGLPPLPPVPEGFDRWVYRGVAWDSTEFTTFASFAENDGQWCIVEDYKPGAYIHHHYAEALRAGDGDDSLLQQEELPPEFAEAMQEHFATAPAKDAPQVWRTDQPRPDECAVPPSALRDEGMAMRMEDMQRALECVWDMWTNGGSLTLAVELVCPFIKPNAKNP